MIWNKAFFVYCCFLFRKHNDLPCLLSIIATVVPTFLALFCPWTVSSHSTDFATD